MKKSEHRSVLVSIGIPTHNRASMLRRAVDSALAQDHHHIEVVISDNASSDSTEEFCRQLCERESRVRYVRQQVNAGQIINLHEVLEYAQGEFFMWLADDDWLDEDYVSRCLDVLLQNPDHALVCGRTKFFRSGENTHDGPVISLSQETGSERVAAYYANLWANEIFYGVMRHAVTRRLPAFQQVMGFDCLISAAIAFLGKVRTIESTHINRELGGTSETPEKMAAILDLPTIQARFYRESIAWFAFRDIAWRSPLYRQLGPWGRLRLAVRSHMGIYRLYVFPKLVPPLLKRAVDSARYRCGKAWQSYFGPSR